MLRTIASAATVVALMPIIWVTSAAWATGLSAGLVVHEMTTRMKKKKA